MKNFLRPIFGSKSDQQAGQIQVEIKTSSDYCESQANKKLKEASVLKKEKKFSEACDALRQAYSLPGAEYLMVSEKLRLPLYLQAAGQNDEGWKEFNKLLLECQSPVEVLYMDHSAIYDKMCLFLQREKKYAEAIKFGILSYLSWMQGLRVQQRKDELDSCLDKGSIKIMLTPLMKKAKLEDRIESVVNAVAQEFKSFPKVDDSRLFAEVYKLLKYERD